MPVEAKVVALSALASDAAAAQRKQPQHVTVIDARQVLYGPGQGATTKKTPAGGTIEIPNRITLAVPRDVLLSMRSKPEDAKVVMLLMVVPAGMVRAIAQRAESPIVSVEQDRAERARLVRP